MDKWEYQVISGNLKPVCERLEKLGEDGWEAVGMNEWISRDLECADYTVLLKRKKPTLPEQIAILEAKLAVVLDPKNPAKDYEEAGRLDAEITKLQEQQE